MSFRATAKSQPLPRLPRARTHARTPIPFHLVPATVAQAVLDMGYEELHTVTHVKIALGLVTCGLALLAQFYPVKFPANYNVLVMCVAGYVFFNTLLQLYITYVEKGIVLFTKPKVGATSQSDPPPGPDRGKNKKKNVTKRGALFGFPLVILLCPPLYPLTSRDAIRRRRHSSVARASPVSRFKP